MIVELTVKDPVMIWLPLKLFEPVVAKLPVLLFNEAVYDNIEALKAFIEALAAYS